LKNLIQIIIIFILLGEASCTIHKKQTNNSSSSNQINENKLISLLINATTEKIIGNLDIADSLFKECLKIDAKNAVSYFELSGIYRIEENPAKSIEFAKKALQFDPSNEWYKANLALFYSELNKHKEASKLFEELTKEYPEKYEYLYSLSECYYFLNDLKKAIAPLDKLEEAIGINEDLILYKYRLYLNINEFDKAVLEVEKLINSNPSNVRYYGILAEFYDSIGDYQNAFKLYQKIISIDPDNGIVQLSLFQYYITLKDTEKALVSLKKAFSSKEINADIKFNLLANILLQYKDDVVLVNSINNLFNILIATHKENSNIYYFYGDFLLRKNDLNGALENFKIAASLKDNNYELWNQIVLLEADLLLYDELEVDSKKAIELFPSHPTFYYFNGIANLQLKKYNLSINAFKDGINYIINDNYLLSDFYQYLGDAYHHINDNISSDNSFEKALSYNPNNTYVLNNYSYYLSLRETRINDAEEMILKALDFSPNNKSYLDTYGWILFLKKDFINAEKWLKKALAISLEKDGTILEHYGDVLFHLNNINDAVYYWGKAIDNGNNSPILKEKISGKTYLK
jgi:tetratricopeptide (TPR) repeat protein